MSGQMTGNSTGAPDKLRNLVLVVNILYAASFVVGITSIVALVLAYMKRGEAVGTIWASHFTYAIRTFWIGLGIAVVGVVLTLVGVGLLILGFVAIWFVVRIVRAFLAWNENVAIADPNRFF